MIIFGIDPGTAITGFGVIRAEKSAVVWIDSGVITTRPSLLLADRLELIYDSLTDKIRKHAPVRVCIEEAFYGKNVHTTLVLGHSRGVAMLAAKKAGAVVAGYSPRQIKKAVTGNGNAAKEQVAYMVKMLLSPPEKHAQTDAYDALAVALCDFHCVCGAGRTVFRGSSRNTLK
ncbi:MAG: crossover junction endodeoxyribonuclease RuvC [Chitinispirillaceae bacterium]|nr:crossover junction endodeoxyribonuclease RuvC [Chitinispirillaceae bacterium]